MAAGLIDGMHGEQCLIFAHGTFGVAGLHHQAAEAFMQLGIDREDEVQAFESGLGFLEFAGVLKKFGVLLYGVRVASADFRIAAELIRGAGLVVFLQAGFGDEIIDVAGFDVVGVDAFDGAAFDDDFVVLAILRELTDFAHGFGPVGEAGDGLAGFLVDHGQEILIESFGRDSELLFDDVDRGTVFGKLVDHIKQLRFAPAFGDVIADFARFVIGNDDLGLIGGVHEAAIDFGDGQEFLVANRGDDFGAQAVAPIGRCGGF